MVSEGTASLRERWTCRSTQGFASFRQPRCCPVDAVLQTKGYGG
jgi:hypothetical protein